MKASIYLRLLPWELPPASMEVGNWPASIYVALATCMNATSYFHALPSTWESEVGSLYGGSSSLGLNLGLGLFLCKQLEVRDTRWSRWKHVGVHGSLRKLSRTLFVEAAIDGSNGSFHLHRQWKLPCTSMEASTNFNGSKSTRTYFHGNFHGSKLVSADFSWNASMK